MNGNDERADDIELLPSVSVGMQEGTHARSEGNLVTSIVRVVANRDGQWGSSRSFNVHS